MKQDDVSDGFGLDQIYRSSKVVVETDIWLCGWVVGLIDGGSRQIY